jgi:hypothetical protein
MANARTFLRVLNYTQKQCAVQEAHDVVEGMLNRASHLTSADHANMQRLADALEDIQLLQDGKQPPQRFQLSLFTGNLEHYPDEEVMEEPHSHGKKNKAAHAPGRTPVKDDGAADTSKKDKKRKVRVSVVVELSITSAGSVASRTPLCKHFMLRVNTCSCDPVCAGQEQRSSQR